MSMIAPIPGQSLTDDPNNFPWERPPEISDPDEAVVYHLDRLSEKKRVNSILFLLEYGFPVDVLARSILTAAVGTGIHTIDVSLLIAPVIEEEISYKGKTAGIKVKDTFSDDETDDELQEKQLRELVLKKLSSKEIKTDKGDENFTRDTIEALGSPEENELQEMQKNKDPEPEQGEMMEEETKPAAGGMGLMSRGV